MKRKEFNELRNKKIEDLTKLAATKKLEAEKVAMKIMSGKEKNLKLERNLRTEIAKILTLVREKEIIESLEVKAEKKEEVKEEKKEEAKGKEKKI